MASRRSSWGGAMETYWAAPAAARDHVAAFDRPSTVCVPVKSARAARGGAQQQGDHEASITPIARCQPDFGRQSMVGWTDCPSGKGSLDLRVVNTEYVDPIVFGIPRNIVYLPLQCKPGC